MAGDREEVAETAPAASEEAHEALEHTAENAILRRLIRRCSLVMPTPMPIQSRSRSVAVGPTLAFVLNGGQASVLMLAWRCRARLRCRTPACLYVEGRAVKEMGEIGYSRRFRRQAWTCGR